MPHPSLVPRPIRLNRRHFLAATSVAACWPFRSLQAESAPDRRVRLDDYPFRLGVASGDPQPDGVVLWTRLAPDPLEGGGLPMENVLVHWEVCSDEAMQHVVRSGKATASPAWAHSVHVEVDGLQPDRVYWYRFKAGSEISPVGRTRTTPATDVMPDRLRFAFASCQNYQQGLYTAYEHLVREDLHAVVHLGDYIYEGPAADQRHIVPRFHNGGELHALEEYRARHALYKTDPHLQAVHLAFPWITTWDDHEFDNNCAGEISEELDVDPETFLKRRACAYQAYYEHLPLRRSTLPRGPHMDLYRVVSYGRLAQFAVLDTRQYRTDQPCGDRNKELCDEALAPQATLLGPKQEQWLFDRLSESKARWNVLAQQVMMARADVLPGPEARFSMDQWSGYDAARQRLLQFLSDQKVSNPVVLTGDIHSNWVNDLKIDFDAADAPTVATEFVGTSISSGGDGTETPSTAAGILAENPFVRFLNSERGYVSCEVTPDAWRSDYRTVDYVTRPGAPCNTRASFIVEAGAPGAVRL